MQPLEQTITILLGAIKEELEFGYRIPFAKGGFLVGGPCHWGTEKVAKVGNEKRLIENYLIGSLSEGFEPKKFDKASDKAF